MAAFSRLHGAPQAFERGQQVRVRAAMQLGVAGEARGRVARRRMGQQQAQGHAAHVQIERQVGVGRRLRLDARCSAAPSDPRPEPRRRREHGVHIIATRHALQPRRRIGEQSHQDVAQGDRLAARQRDRRVERAAQPRDPARQARFSHAAWLLGPLRLHQPCWTAPRCLSTRAARWRFEGGFSWRWPALGRLLAGECYQQAAARECGGVRLFLLTSVAQGLQFAIRFDERAFFAPRSRSPRPGEGAFFCA